MSSLTEEQRRRAEENRQRALQKLAAAKAAAAAAGLQSQPQPKSGSQTRPQFNIPSAASNTFSSSTTTYPVRNPSVNNYQSQNKQSSSSFSNSGNYSQNSAGKFNGTQNYRPSLPTQKCSSNSSSSGPTSTQSNSSNKPLPVYSGPTVTGTCRMISRDRFIVDMGYHAQTVALFKTIDGSRYEPMGKKWTFPLSQHPKVIAAIDSLKPQVTVCPLPSFALRIFRNAETTSRIPDVDLSRIDPVLVHALLPFQREGVCFGISREGRVLVADDMGLGKTIQALGIAHYYYNEWPLLIAAPSSMRYSWREAIWNWLPSVPAGSVAVVESKNDSVYDAKVMIMSYDLLHKRADEPPVRNCKVVIMDESHHLKNWKTARAKAAIPILQNAKRAILLSGTPALSRPIELYTQLSAISPLNRNIFPPVHDFGIRYCAGKKNAWGWDHSGSSNMEELHLVLEETIMIRRLKSDVLKQLPDKRRQKVVLDPKLVKWKKNEALKLKATAYLNERDKTKSVAKHGKLLEYFSETGKAKIDAVKNYILDLIEGGKKFLCFAHHRCVLDGISDALEQANCGYIRIDGSTHSEERKQLCDKFQTSDSCLVAVLSITAANSGITLTAANLVLFAELFWNPGVLTQAEDRAHRIGQQDCVIVQYLVAKGTADDDLWTMVADKLDVLNKAGLSKDNFREANDEPLLYQQKNNQHNQSPSKSQSQSQSQSSSQKQTGIHDFFRPIPSSPNQNQNQSKIQIQNQNSKINNSSNQAQVVDENLDQDVACFFDETFDDAHDEDFLSVPVPDAEFLEEAFEAPFDSQPSNKSPTISPPPNQNSPDIFDDDIDDDGDFDANDHIYNNSDNLDMDEGDSLLFSEGNFELLDKLEAASSTSHSVPKQAPMPGGFFLPSEFESSSKLSKTSSGQSKHQNNGVHGSNNSNNNWNTNSNGRQQQLQQQQRRQYSPSLNSNSSSGNKKSKYGL